MNRDELTRQLAEVDALERLSKAKGAHRSKPTGRTRAALHVAKREVAQARGARRTRGTNLGRDLDDGVAAPTTVKPKIKDN